MAQGRAASRSARRGARRARSHATPRPRSRWAPRKTLKKGTAAAWRAARARCPRSSVSTRDRETTAPRTRPRHARRAVAQGRGSRPPRGVPYTIRLVSEILESNGSCSMASVCGATLALMDAGVPIKGRRGHRRRPRHRTKHQHPSSPTWGREYHYGDMDFKVAGTHDGSLPPSNWTSRWAASPRPRGGRPEQAPVAGSTSSIACSSTSPRRAHRHQPARTAHHQPPRSRWTRSAS